MNPNSTIYTNATDNMILFEYWCIYIIFMHICPCILFIPNKIYSTIYYYVYDNKETPIPIIQTEQQIIIPQPTTVCICEPKYEDKYKDKLLEHSLQIRSNYDTCDASMIEEEWKHLKNNILIENTPVGNVLMYYDSFKDTFIYYSDRIVPYKYLDTVGRKYVLQFKCVQLYYDQYPQHMPELLLLSPTSLFVPKTQIIPTGLSTYSVVAPKKKTGDVFAKLKTYNKPTVSELKDSSDQKINRYTYSGKLMNFLFLKKVTSNKMSYAEYKKNTTKQNKIN